MARLRAGLLRPQLNTAQVVLRLPLCRLRNTKRRCSKTRFVLYPIALHASHQKKPTSVVPGKSRWALSLDQLLGPWLPQFSANVGLLSNNDIQISEDDRRCSRTALSVYRTGIENKVVNECGKQAAEATPTSNNKLPRDEGSLGQGDVPVGLGHSLSRRPPEGKQLGNEQDLYKQPDAMCCGGKKTSSRPFSPRLL